MTMDSLSLEMKEATPPLGERILAVFRKSGAFWCVNTVFHLLFTPTLITLFVLKQTQIGLILLSLGVIPILLSIGQNEFHKRGIHPLLDKYVEEQEGVEEFIEKIKKNLRINALCCIPVFGIFTSFFASKSYCMLDVFRYKGGSLMKNGIQNCRRCFKSFLVAHAGSIISTNACGILLAFHDNSNALFGFYIFLGFSVAWNVVSGMITGIFVKNNIRMSHRVRRDGGINEEIFKQMEVGKKSIKSNFIVYIPFLSVFAMIPFFIAREILADMEVIKGKHNRQYVKKCKVFMHILTWGSLISLPYIICISILGKWSANPGLAVPLCFNLITSTAINFGLSCEQQVYAEMYLSDSEHYQDIKVLNSISKLCSGLIIFTLVSAFPSIIVFMKKLREFRKKEGITYDNRIKKLVTKK